ncbi:hypothetical protein F511_27214 [Dorcoceras hygrometricum]|uniref:Uncharacterized protein n=1 Tax=Dorcoceras hygrometricum TaxID=472368 RepID=A0A2Z7BNU3_9LAMI|nr:hypothetical protein F511_27214 [Dorcoceras hygrometricum]
MVKWQHRGVRDPESFSSFQLVSERRFWWGTSLLRGAQKSNCELMPPRRARDQQDDATPHPPPQLTPYERACVDMIAGISRSLPGASHLPCTLLAPVITPRPLLSPGHHMPTNIRLVRPRTTPYYENLALIPT